MEKVFITWWMGDDNDLNGSFKVGDYECIVGIQKEEDYKSHQAVGLFIHCVKPYELELIDRVCSTTAEALNVLYNLSVDYVMNLIDIEESRL